jgi:hypothetical protein
MSDNLGILSAIVAVCIMVTSLGGGILYTVAVTHVDTVTSCTTTYVGPQQ